MSIFEMHISAIAIEILFVNKNERRSAYLHIKGEFPFSQCFFTLQTVCVFPELI